MLPAERVTRWPALLLASGLLALLPHAVAVSPEPAGVLAEAAPRLEADLASGAWIAGGVALAAFAGAGGVVLLRRRAEAPWSVEYCNDRAGLCREAGDLPRALEWIRRARRLAPASAKLAADEGDCFARLGDVAGALAAYAEAHALATHGEYAFGAAILLRDSGASMPAVEERLAACLEKSPDALEEVEAEFPEVARRVSWKATARLARLRSP